MAVDPELRRVSERSMIRATIAVITNVRRDHLEVIGPDLGTAARNLADVIPEGGTVVTAEERLLPVMRKEAERRGARIVSVDPHTVSDGLLDSFPYITFRENVALAIAVSDLLGLDRNRSVQGMLHSTPDFGTVRLFERTNEAGPYTVVCALGVQYNILLPVFAKSVFRVGARGYGLLLTAAGIGSMTTWLSRCRPDAPTGRSCCAPGRWRTRPM